MSYALRYPAEERIRNAVKGAVALGKGNARQRIASKGVGCAGGETQGAVSMGAESTGSAERRQTQIYFKSRGKMSKFKIGDRVRHVGDEAIFAGKTGVAVYALKGDIGVRFDERIPCGHTLGGRCENYHGWRMRHE